MTLNEIATAYAAAVRKSGEAAAEVGRIENEFAKACEEARVASEEVRRLRAELLTIAASEGASEGIGKVVVGAEPRSS